MNATKHLYETIIPEYGKVIDARTEAFLKEHGTFDEICNTKRYAYNLLDYASTVYLHPRGMNMRHLV
jgi:hypothetical protein